MTALFTLMLATALPFALLYLLEKKGLARNTLSMTRKERYVWWTLMLFIVEFAILAFGLFYDRKMPETKLTQHRYGISENYPITLSTKGGEASYIFFTQKKETETGNILELRTQKETETDVIVDKGVKHPFFIKNNCDEFYRFDWVMFMKVKDVECQKKNRNEIHIPKLYKIANQDNAAN